MASARHTTRHAPPERTHTARLSLGVAWHHHRLLLLLLLHTLSRAQSAFVPAAAFSTEKLRRADSSPRAAAVSIELPMHAGTR